MQPCFWAAATIRHAEIDGLRIILDFRTESYRVLDDIASALWPILLGESEVAASCAALAERYAVDQGRVRSDLVDFARTCLEDGLLQTVPPSAVSAADAPKQVRGPIQLRALLCLILTKWSLGRHGFRATYERYSVLALGSDGPTIESLMAAFTRAENFFVSRRAPGDCLLRSLALYRYLRSANVEAEHVIGVRRFPFNAHAWVEFHGLPLLDNSSRQYAPLARIGAVAA